MGYVANINMALKIKPKMKEKLMQEIDNATDIDLDYIFDGDGFEVQRGKNTTKLLCGQYYDNYNDEEWYKFLHLITPYIEDGEMIECIGEDDSRWAFQKREGKWYECEAKTVYDEGKEIQEV